MILLTSVPSTKSVFAAQEDYLTDTVVDALNTPSEISTFDLYGDLSLISPKRFLPKSKGEKERIADEKLERARALAMLEYEANKREPRTHATRSDFENSATNYDQNGEIIIAAKLRPVGFAGTASVMNSTLGSYTQSGSFWLVIIVMFMIVIFLVKINFLNKPKRYHQPYRHQRRPYKIRKSISSRNNAFKYRHI